ncbi:MAG: trimethylamine methyltransferase family protein [Desulforhopalus sp.]
MKDSLKLRFMSDSEVDQIYEKSISILTDKGVKVEYEKALKLLEKGGATVDYATENVKFPRELIEECLKNAPKEFTVKGSGEQHDLKLPHPTGSFYSSTCVQTMKYWDPETKWYTDVTAKSWAEWCQLCEILDNVHKVAIQTPMDVPAETADVHALSIQLQNTSKPLMILAYCPETVEYHFELLLAKAGSVEALRERPIALTYPTSLSPLKFKPMDLETIMQSCHYGIPIVGNSLAIAGATAPVTEAGTALLAVVEILAMLVMSQMFKPGAPFIASTYTTTMDMATGSALLANAESMRSRAAATQVIKERFNIPAETFSFMADSYLSDGQAAMEKSLMPALLDLSGSDIQYGMGRLGGSTFASPIQMIIDNDLFSVIEKCNSKLVVNDDTLALDDILTQSPDSQFVTTMHTLQHCRDIIRPELLVSKSVDSWKEAGGKDLYERAVDKYNDLKKQFQPQEIDEDVVKEMDKIVQHADEKLVGKLM